MISRWQLDIGALLDGALFKTAPKEEECPYCRNMFRPRWYNPSPDETFGHWQVCCSVLCNKLWKREQAEDHNGDVNNME